MKTRKPAYAVRMELMLEAATLIFRRVRRRAKKRFQVSVVGPSLVDWPPGFGEGDAELVLDACRTIRRTGEDFEAK
jgi:hypothetical protein